MPRINALLAFLPLATMLSLPACVGERSAADCDRACLADVITRFLDSLVAHDPALVPLADGALLLFMARGAIKIWRDGQLETRGGGATAGLLSRGLPSASLGARRQNVEVPIATRREASAVTGRHSSSTRRAGRTELTICHTPAPRVSADK